MRYRIYNMYVTHACLCVCIYRRMRKSRASVDMPLCVPSSLPSFPPPSLSVHTYTIPGRQYIPPLTLLHIHFHDRVRLGNRDCKSALHYLRETACKCKKWIRWDSIMYAIANKDYICYNLRFRCFDAHDNNFSFYAKRVFAINDVGRIHFSFLAWKIVFVKIISTSISQIEICDERIIWLFNIFSI